MILRKISKPSRILFLVSIVFLMLSQSLNLFNAAPSRTFENGLTPLGDGQFVGKLGYSRQVSLWDENMLFMLQVKATKTASERTEEENKTHRSTPWIYSFNSYLENGPIQEISPYQSKIQLTSFLVCLIDKVFHPNPHFFLKLIMLTNQLLLSIVLSIIIVWISKVTNLFWGVVTMSLLVFSPLIILMSGSLYFTFFTWFLPFAVGVTFLHLEQTGRMTLGTKHYIILAMLFFYHLLSHCFEFICSLGIMAVIPFILYGLWSNDYLSSFKRLVGMSITYVLMIVFAILILLFSIGKSEGGGIQSGLEHVKERFELRALNKEDAGGKAFAKDRHDLAKEVTTKEILDIHLDKDLTSFYFSHYKIFLTFRRFIFGALLLSIIGLIIALNKKIEVQKTVAIFVTTWFSITAPLSWFLIFKPHSFLHHHFTPSTWYTPFVFMCILMIAHSIGILIKVYKKPTV